MIDVSWVLVYNASALEKTSTVAREFWESFFQDYSGVQEGFLVASAKMGSKKRQGLPCLTVNIGTSLTNLSHYPQTSSSWLTLKSLLPTKLEPGICKHSITGSHFCQLGIQANPSRPSTNPAYVQALVATDHSLYKKFRQFSLEMQSQCVKKLSSKPFFSGSQKAESCIRD
jgi:hypothetical protein